MKKQRDDVFLGDDPFPELSELYASFDEEMKRIDEENERFLRELDEACKQDFEPVLDALKEWCRQELEPGKIEMEKELDSLQTPD